MFDKTRITWGQSIEKYFQTAKEQNDIHILHSIKRNDVNPKRFNNFIDKFICSWSLKTHNYIRSYLPLFLLLDSSLHLLVKNDSNHILLESYCYKHWSHINEIKWNYNETKNHHSNLILKYTKLNCCIYEKNIHMYSWRN